MDCINRAYRREIAAVRKTGNRDEVDRIGGAWVGESAQIEEELNLLETRRLVNEAQRLRLPVPDKPTGDTEDDNWIRGDLSEQWCLKAEGYSKIRAQIRIEREERREALMALATIITGIIGALMGLVAVWRR
ncbi:MAG: hypothetical protein ABSA97_02395 [Verrucomicrobiia bacterium]